MNERTPQRRSLESILLAVAVLLAVGAAVGVSACGKVVDVHETEQVKGTPCVTCHRSAFLAATNPKHEGVMPETCEKCHTTTHWVPASAGDHEWFALRNKHVPVACAQCHTKGYAPGATPKECVGCHQRDYDEAKSPRHTGMSTTCIECHDDRGWKPSTYAHEWPLNGAHKSTACPSCHTGTPPRYEGTPETCVGCHQKDYDGAKEPPHTGLETNCTKCHNEVAWKPSTFKHSWVLDGAHLKIACSSCHVGTPPVYKGTAKACVSCHLDDYQRSTFPGHSTFSQSCEQCHGRVAWKPALNGAHPENKFPIKTGAHSRASITCTSCHNPMLGTSAGGKNTDCVGCHTGEHTRAKMDEKHKEERDYPLGPAAPNFCLKCHPNGKN